MTGIVSRLVAGHSEPSFKIRSIIAMKGLGFDGAGVNRYNVLVGAELINVSLKDIENMSKTGCVFQGVQT